MSEEHIYCDTLTRYSRRDTIEVNIGDVPVGGSNPVRIQSMTTVDTMDTKGSIEESIRMIESGCEYIRITAPSIKEAKNLENIRNGLHEAGYTTPLIADIHFTPNAAELAARIVEKVRVNPGNYADKKKFNIIEYDDASYQQELDRIREKFVPLVKICKEYGTAMRIGTNHGSLSDRIMSRFGDTPFGMVESALEFVRICEDLDYHQLVLSMKASNTRIMVQAYRLLVNKLNEEGLKPYPLHLGVTEAGEGEDGRIKSAVGIGALLEDGLGDTVRVSLTEPPEFEAPVAKKLVDRYTRRSNHEPIIPIEFSPGNPFEYLKRQTFEVENIGGDNVPRVITDFSGYDRIDPEHLEEAGHLYDANLDKWHMSDHGADYIYTGNATLDFMLPNGLKRIVDYSVWEKEKGDLIPFGTIEDFIHGTSDTINLVKVTIDQMYQLSEIKDLGKVVLVFDSQNEHRMADLRRFVFDLINRKNRLPVILKSEYSTWEDDTQLYASTDVGGVLIDGMGDGIWLVNPTLSIEAVNRLSFGILQAARTRMTKTEYISCPSCGRTLFDLQETTAMIRKRTDHLKGVKIGIMGCIVNGPGEMADADYGYVGSGKGKITLYRGQEVVKRAVPSENAVDELIEIIRTDGNWVEPAKKIESESLNS